MVTIGMCGLIVAMSAIEAASVVSTMMSPEIFTEYRRPARSGNDANALA